MTIPLDHYMKRFEAFNEFSVVTSRIRPNPVRALHYKCENWSFGAKIVDQNMSKQEQVLESKTFVPVFHFLYRALC